MDPAEILIKDQRKLKNGLPQVERKRENQAGYGRLCLRRRHWDSGKEQKRIAAKFWLQNIRLTLVLVKWNGGEVPSFHKKLYLFYLSDLKDFGKSWQGFMFVLMLRGQAVRLFSDESGYLSP